MSRVFTIAGESIAIPAAALFNNFTTVTYAAWINTSDYGTGAPIIVKDINTYDTYFWLDSDGTLFGSAGFPSLTGSIKTWTVNAGGLGYAFADTGHTTGTGTVDAPYSIFGVGAGGAVTSAGSAPSNPFGDGFTVGDVTATVHTTGSGNNGLTLNITQINATLSTATSNETVPLNTWTHVAMTWSAKVIKLYINGVECTYSARVSTGLQDTSTGGYNIGSDTFGDNPVMDIAEFDIYTTALTGVQIAALAASTTGAPILPDGYWHLCGVASPEPDSSGNGNDGVLSTPAPAQGPDSPGYACAGPAVATNNTIGVGAYGGDSLANAFYNPQNLDLIQIVAEGGDIVWSLTATGTATVNPGSHTTTALLGRYEGASFARAFYNPYSKDIFQVISPGDDVVFWVDSTGAAHT